MLLRWLHAGVPWPVQLQIDAYMSTTFHCPGPFDSRKAFLPDLELQSFSDTGFPYPKVSDLLAISDLLLIILQGKWKNS